jgi:hypothetical protein
MLAIAVPVSLVGLGGYIHLWVKSNVNEAYFLSIKDLIEAKFEGQEKLFNERLNTIDYRLDRIEHSMNGHLKVENRA